MAINYLSGIEHCITTCIFYIYGALMTGITIKPLYGSTSVNYCIFWYKVLVQKSGFVVFASGMMTFIRNKDSKIFYVITQRHCFGVKNAFCTNIWLYFYTIR